MKEYKIGQTVYHKDVYDFREPLKVVGIRKDDLELEGDFSGGTNSTLETSWFSRSGTSVIYDYRYKRECRNKVLALQASMLADDKNNIKAKRTNDLNDLIHMVFYLTTDASLNPMPGDEENQFHPVPKVEKVVRCRECGGSGRLLNYTYQLGNHSIKCWWCGGTGIK